MLHTTAYTNCNIILHRDCTMYKHKLLEAASVSWQFTHVALRGELVLLPCGQFPSHKVCSFSRCSRRQTGAPANITRSVRALPRAQHIAMVCSLRPMHAAREGDCSHCPQNALFNSALRQSTSIRKDLDQFADSSSPSPHLQAQLNASLTSFARTIDDYGKLAKQEPVQTKQERAFERLKNFRTDLDEYRDSFKRIKGLNEDLVRPRTWQHSRWLTTRYSKPQRHAQSCLAADLIMPPRPKTRTRSPMPVQHSIRPSHPRSRIIPPLPIVPTPTQQAHHRAATTTAKATFCARIPSSIRHRSSWTSFSIEAGLSWATWDNREKCSRVRREDYTL